MSDDRTFEISGDIMAKTDKAVLVDVGVDEIWVPYSQVDGLKDEVEEIWNTTPEGENKTIDSIELPYWLAKKKGLVEND